MTNCNIFIGIGTGQVNCRRISSRPWKRIFWKIFCAIISSRDYLSYLHTFSSEISRGNSYFCPIFRRKKQPKNGQQPLFVLIAAVNGLTGFPEAINSIFPETEVQLCIIHQILNSMKYIASKNQKAFMADLKPVYKAPTIDAAEDALDALEWRPSGENSIPSWSNPGATNGKIYRYTLNILNRYVVWFIQPIPLKPYIVSFVNWQKPKADFRTKTVY